MELIHSDKNRIELRQLTDFSVWDNVSGLDFSAQSNTFQLTVPESTWSAMPILKKHFLYEPETEFGGRVKKVHHVDGSIHLSGKTFRGELSNKIISPPAGQAYKIISAVDAHTALTDLIGSQFGGLYQVVGGPCGVNVSGQFRYANLLGGIHSMLNQYGLRLKIEFDGETVWLSAEPVLDLSETEELSQDYSVKIESIDDETESFNHIICLGKGELTNREVVELFRTESGEITETPLSEGIEDVQSVLDFPNAESSEELTRSGIEKLIEAAPRKEVSVDLSQTQGLNLGDLVGGRDRVTGQTIVQPIIQIIRRVDSAGESIEYKVGG